MDKISINDFISVQEKHEEVRESEKPFAVHKTNGEISVVGDANMTQVAEPMDIDITFRFTKDELDSIPQDAKQVGNYVTVVRTFKDVAITPRNDAYLMEAILGIYPFITEIEDCVQERSEKLEEFNKKFGTELTEIPKDISELPKAQQTALNEIVRANSLRLIHSYNSIGDTAQDAMYKFSAVLLGIDEFLEEHMATFSVIHVIYKMMETNPEFFNEAETVFGL